uniref:Uncharacterized protein n=1 Tax=Anopheles atroparvus TaxID=41427 RepID=A0A182JFB2_ANOAO
MHKKDLPKSAALGPLLALLLPPPFPPPPPPPSFDDRDDEERPCRWFCCEDPGPPWLALMVTLGVGCCLLEFTEGELEPRVIEIESFPISRLAPWGDPEDSEEDDAFPPPPPIIASTAPSATHAAPNATRHAARRATPTGTGIAGVAAVAVAAAVALLALAPAGSTLAGVSTASATASTAASTTRRPTATARGCGGGSGGRGIHRTEPQAGERTGQIVRERQLGCHAGGLQAGEVILGRQLSHRPPT